MGVILRGSLGRDNVKSWLGSMRILFASVPYRPSVGGIETVTSVLVAHFHRAGHELVLITRTPFEGADPEPFRVIRNPTAAQLWGLARWADVVFHNNISLHWAWPPILLGKPWIIAHHTWIPREGPHRWAGRLKRLALSRATNISVSRAMADSLPVKSQVVPNPYDNRTFVQIPGIPKTRDLVFLGRLVSDKGLPVLLGALRILAQEGRYPNLTVIGCGPEEVGLRELTKSLGLVQQVDFVGKREGPCLVELLNRHSILVVPSVWEEPFGIVVLEGLACGCIPLVAQSGGLPEATGGCGVVFPKGDAQGLAQRVSRLLDDEAELARLRAGASHHLATHAPERVADAYLAVVEDALRN